MENLKKNTVKLFAACAIFAIATSSGCAVTTINTGEANPVEAKPDVAQAPAPTPAPTPEPAVDEHEQTPQQETPETEEAPAQPGDKNVDRYGGTKIERIDGPFYNVKIRKKRVDNDKVVTRIIVTPKNKYHCNMEFPWKVTPAPKGGVKVGKRSFGKGDAAVFSEPKVVFEIPYSAPVGVNLKAKLKGSLCTKKACETFKVDLTL